MSRARSHAAAGADPARQARLLEQAARLLDEGMVVDAAQALRKAQRDVNWRGSPAQLPSTTEVMDALARRRALFGSAEPHDAADLAQWREALLEAMQFLSVFQPRLHTDALDTNQPRLELRLDLHADRPAEVLEFLRTHHIPVTLATAHIALVNGERMAVETCAFEADGLPFLLRILPEAALRQPPRAADGTTLARMSRAQLQAWQPR